MGGPQLKNERSPAEQLWGGLIEKVALKDQAALGELYDQTSPFVYGLILRILGDRPSAEEVTLDVYMQVWNQAERYSPERGAASSWLLILGRSRAIDHIRSRAHRGRDKEQPLSAGYACTGPGANPEDRFLLKGRRKMVEQALASLPPEQRAAIELAFFSGLTHNEIAEHLGEPLGTVKSRIRSGLTSLRIVLEPLS